MTTKTDFHAVQELQTEYTPREHGMLSGEEIKIIRKVLEIEKRNNIELQNIRDFVVILYGQWAEELRNGKRQSMNAGTGMNFEQCMDAMSAITYAIDLEKGSRGLEV